MNVKNPRYIVDVLLAILLLVCVGLTWRSCGEKSAEREAAPPAAEIPPPTPEQADPDPQRTLMIAAMTFFEHIVNKRYGEAAEMFADAPQQKDWAANLNRVEKYGNPIAEYRIEKRLQNKYCRLDEADEEKAKCEFPIHLRRRDKDISEYAWVGMELKKEGPLWRIEHYNQEKIEKETYDQRLTTLEEPAKQAPDRKE